MESRNAQGTKAIGDEPNTYLTMEASDIDERQCTLCLEPRGTGEGSGGTVAVTECGHVFCWGCLGGLDKVSIFLLGTSHH
jgi:peroxin-10